MSGAALLSPKDGEVVELLRGGSVFVLTGAGVSTDSGIPDYRDEAGAWKRKQPVQFRDFVHSEPTRRRYWARSLIGWRLMRGVQPNTAHEALAKLEERGVLSLTVTQNVDGLHQRAGSRRVLDLHGRIDAVVCLRCGKQSSREALQRELLARNPGFAALEAARAPDGDADLVIAVDQFQIVDCPDCGGLLKPDVVFFGENVPKERVDSALSQLSRSGALLVAGSSLMVFSGFRFVRAAVKAGLPVIVVNQGRTRADELASVKLSGNAGIILSDLLERL